MRLFYSKTHHVPISTWVQIPSVWVDGRNARSSWADPWLKRFSNKKPIILPMLSDVMGFTFLLNTGSSHSVSSLSSLCLFHPVFYLLDGWGSSWYWIRRKLPGLTGGFESWDLSWSVHVAMGCQVQSFSFFSVSTFSKLYFYFHGESWHK